jgi:hypothetical protein
MTALLNKIVDWFFTPSHLRLDERDLHETLSWIGRSELRELHPNLMELV